MLREEFEKIVEEEFPRAVPEKFHHLIKNVGFLVEDEPSKETRREQDLHPNETLLGLYRGTPHTARGDFYGVGPTVPDTITLYQRPIEEEANEQAQAEGKAWPSGLERPPRGLASEALRKVIRDTIWHEVAHYFGYDEHQVRGREAKHPSERSDKN